MIGLSEVDAGNHPMNSLRSILLSWDPSTYANFAQRIACLDQVLNSYPDVGWALLVRLFPAVHDIHWPTQRPRMRDFAPKTPEVMTFAVVWRYQGEIVQRALQLAGDDESRNIVIVKSFSAFTPEAQQQVFVHLEAYLKRNQTPGGCLLWHELNAELSRHEFFVDSDWAMREPERQRIRQLLEAYKPTDPLAAELQLFDDWTPNVGRYEPGKELESAENLRAESIDRILAQEGADGILRLAGRVKLPQLIGPALASSSISIDQLSEVLVRGLESNVPGDLGFYASAVGVPKFGDPWKQIVRSVVDKESSAARKAHLIHGWPLVHATWKLVDELGDAVRSEYWASVQQLPATGTTDDVLYAIEQLRQQKRSIDLLRMITTKIKVVSSELLLTLLKESLPDLGTGIKQMGNMLSFYINRIFSELKTRSDVSELSLAEMEFGFYPVTFSAEPSTVLHAALAKEPLFYIEVLCQAFRPKNLDGNSEPTDDDIARGRVSRRLLRQLQIVPGLENGKIKGTVLSWWVDEARSFAAEADRTEIADYYIGRLLAHAPIDSDHPEAWPPAAISELIDRVMSEDLEEGILSQCLDKASVSVREFNEGGDRERGLAREYEAWADDANQYARVPLLLSRIAKAWLERALQEDSDAEKRKMIR
jgi:hypothetical protein